jgi:hypothetical protein
VIAWTKFPALSTYSTNPVHTYSIEERMKTLERLDRYLKEISKITHAKNIPQYGQVIPLSRSRKQ